MKQTFGNFASFGPRSIELFESSDPHITSIYFTNDVDRHDKISDARFQALHFGHRDTRDKWYNETWYIRKPGEDYFIELMGGNNNSRGTMENGTCTNPWEDLSFKRKYEFHRHDQDLLFRFNSEFNFMKLIGRVSKDEYDFRESVITEDFGMDKIGVAIKLPYLKLPSDVRKIEYLYKISDTNKYIVVDYPHYGFTYDTHRCYLVEDDTFEELKVSKFERYRDGGTTYFDATDNNGVVHKFYSPTHFQPDLKPSWDNFEMISVYEDTEIMDKLLQLLNIEVVKKTARELEYDNL